jgi:DNA-binding beta-propeller fold protein YncE
MPTYDLGALRFNFRADYSAATSYAFNDVVSDPSGLYVYVGDFATTGVALSDTARWKLMLPMDATTRARTSAFLMGS